jgi:archaellum biogenesis protein FlaJ (TadC family)
MENNNNNSRSTHAIRNWFPLSVAAAATTFVVTFVMHIPQEQTIIATALVGILVFSGFLFRSFGVD